MLRWAHITQNETVEVTRPCKDKDDAIEQAKWAWEQRSKVEKSDKFRHEIAALVNVDDDGVYVEDEHGNIDSDFREIAWQDGFAEVETNIAGQSKEGRCERCLHCGDEPNAGLINHCFNEEISEEEHDRVRNNGGENCKGFTECLKDSNFVD